MTAHGVEVEAGRDRTARGLTAATAVSLVLRLVGIVVGMTTTALLARALEPAGYGTLSLALTLVTAAVFTADLGIELTVTPRIARQDAEAAGRTLATALAIRTTTALVATVGLLTAAILGVFGESSAVVAVAALATPLSAAAVLTAGSTARFRPEIAALLMLIQGLLWFGSVVLVHRTGGSLLMLSWCFVGVTLIQTSVAVALNRKVVPLGRPSILEARRILSISWPLAIGAIAYTAYYRLDSVILFHARGATELGYYAAAAKFIDVALLAPSILAAPLLPLAATSMTMDVAADASS